MDPKQAAEEILKDSQSVFETMTDLLIKDFLKAKELGLSDEERDKYLDEHAEDRARELEQLHPELKQ